MARIRFITPVVSFFIVLSLSNAKADSATENVRVRIESSRNEFHFSGLDVQIQGVSLPSLGVQRLTGIQSLQVTRERKNSKLYWVLNYETHGQKQKRVFGYNELHIQGASLLKSGQALPHELIFIGKEKFDVIAAVPLEQYLVGVVSNEMPQSWPIEALKAQAIAARSYTLAVMKERAKRTYHVESTIHDQVFKYVSQAFALSPQMSRVIEAVQATQGQILVGKSNSAVLKAYYHADCGGKTASSRSVWGNGNLVGGAVDQSCPSTPKSRWTFQIQKEKLREKLRALFKFSVNPMRIASLDFNHSQQDSRVQRVTVGFESGLKKSISGQEFRQALGFSELRSTKFRVTEKDDQYLFMGAGFGHGVGLCQWGTKSMAEKGQSHIEILMHYYSESGISRL